MTKRALIILTALGVLASGCELAVPLLVAELDGNDDGFDTSSASLSVQVESAEGRVGEQALSPDMLHATGNRHGQQLDFSIDVGGPNVVLQVMVAQADGSSVNPYHGGSFEGEGRIPPDLAHASDGGTFDVQGIAQEPGARVMLCSPSGCQGAEDFDIQIEQTATGRVASFDGDFGDGQHAHVVLQYTEDS